MVESFLALEVSAADIAWLREGIDQQTIVSAIINTSTNDAPLLKFQIELAPQFETTAAETLLTAPEAQALALLALRVLHEPHLVSPIGDTGIRMMRMERTVLDDGSGIELAIFYRVTDSVIMILDVQRLGASDIFISQHGFLDAAIAEIAGTGSDARADDKAATPLLHHLPRTVAATFFDVRKSLRRAS